jgi:hypothetical protein
VDIPQWLQDLMDLLDLDISQQASWAKRWNSLTIGPPFIDHLNQLSKGWSLLRGKQNLIKQMLERGLISERVLAYATAQERGLGFVDLECVNIQKADLQGVPRDLVTQTRSLPVKRDGKNLWVAICHEDYRYSFAEYAEATGCRIIPVLATADALDRAIQKHFPDGG